MEPKTYCFTIRIIGTGDSIQDAWEDALDATGTVTDNMEYESAEDLDQHPITPEN